MTVTLRSMTDAEFSDWQEQIAQDYAAEQIEAGRWLPEEAVQRARDENKQRLSQGLRTPRMLLLRGIDADGDPIGRAWVGLDHPRGTPGVAFLYDIEILEAKRGHGLGRALLEAVEFAAKDAGASALELNVFGPNAVAIRLYGSAGYGVVTQQMRKDF